MSFYTELLNVSMVEVLPDKKITLYRTRKVIITGENELTLFINCGKSLNHLWMFVTNRRLLW